MKESDIQKSIINYLEYRKDIYFFRAGSGAIQTKDNRYFKTGRKGCPDIVCSVKGLFVGFEIKSEKGRQSEAQKQAQQDIENSGGLYFIVRSIDDVVDILDNKI